MTEVTDEEVFWVRTGSVTSKDLRSPIVCDIPFERFQKQKERPFRDALLKLSFEAG